MEFNPSALLELLQESGVYYKQNSISYILTCPKCNKRDKVYCRKSNGQFVCFVCAAVDNFRGKPEYLLAELTGRSIEYLRERLYGDKKYAAELYLTLDFNDSWGQDEDVFEEAIVNWPYNFYSIETAEAKRGAAYLAARGIPLTVAQQYDLRYSPEERRVYFPIKKGGYLLGWQGRYILPTEYVISGVKKSIPKILSSTGIDREHNLMFQDGLIGSEHAILCEGPMDALKAVLCGGNIATMGKVINKGQIDVLRQRKIKRIYLALDPDAAEEMNLLVDKLQGEFELYNMMPEQGDLGGMTFETVYQLFLNAPRIDAGRIFIYLRNF